MLKDLLEKVKIVSNKKYVVQIKYGVMPQIVVFVLKIVIIIIANVGNVQQVQFQLLMDYHVFVIQMIKYMILIVILVKIDVLIISYGLIINAHVSHNIVGGIKIVKNVQTIH